MYDSPSYRKLTMLAKWGILTHLSCLVLTERTISISKEAKMGWQNTFLSENIMISFNILPITFI
jgi:hypothetical protein